MSRLRWSGKSTITTAKPRELTILSNSAVVDGSE